MLLGVCVSLGSATSLASLAVYVGKDLTRDGSVMLAGFGDEPSSHWLSIVPRRQHPEGATIEVGADGPAGWGNALPGERIRIPQPRETFRYISMDYSEFAGFPAPLTNGGMNEHGLGVRDVALFSREELVAMTPDPQRGPHYADLARIALERARTAREALDVVVGLIERHGYTTYGGNSHVFADPEEGWVLLEFAGGRGLWVARRLGSDELWMNWRGYHELGYVQALPADWRNDPDYLASDHFISFAVDRGWHPPVAPGGSFDVIEAYARSEQYSDETEREALRVRAALEAAAGDIDLEMLMAHIHAAGRDSSGYGQVARLRAGLEADLRTLWVAPGPPITAPFIPWRIGVEAVPPEYQRHRYLTAGEDKRNISPGQRGIESTRYANRAVKRLLYLVEEHRDEFLPGVEAALAGFERQLRAAQPEVEQSARLLSEAGEPGLARRLLTEHANMAAGEGLRLIQDLAVGIEARTRARHGIRGPAP